MARPTGRALRQEIIDTATGLIQQVGVRAFSYGVLAAELGVKAPSIHHHFRTKEDLVAAVAAEYRERFAERAAGLDGATAIERLDGYARLYADTVRADRFCLCGAVASEWLTVGEEPKREVQRFFDEQLAWLERELAAGVDAGELDADLDVPATAQTMLASLEGAMLLGRAGGTPDLPSTVGAMLLGLAAPTT